MENIRFAYNNNKLNISAPSWNDEFDLPDGSNYISDIQDCFNYIIKKHEAIANNPPVQLYVNKIEKRTVLKIKTGCKLELLSPEWMKLLRSTKKDVDQDKDFKNVPKLESVEAVLVHLINNNYQQASKVLITFEPNKKFGQLITTVPHSLTMLNTTNTEFSTIKVWFIDQYSKQLEIEDNVNMALIIG